MKKVLCLIALIAATSVSAQSPDVPRSRHDGLVGSCGSCVPASDGVIHFRFSPGSGIVTENIGGTLTKRLNLIIQVRGSKKTTERPQLIDQVSAGINYSETTFGTLLYTPAWFNLFGTPVANARCTATRSDFFTGGEASYVLVVTDDSNTILGLTEETTSITNNTALPSTFATLTDKFVDFITITCSVIDEETEADVSFTAVAADATGVRLIDANDANDPIFRRSILPVADNDLRGLRLDGKTWAEDYSRYSDGRGVRLKFSKGVYADNGGTKAALTAANFVVYDSGGSSTTITINDVEHTADDPYVTIDINSAPAGAVIRLVSNGASTVKDIDDNELADGNFVASLEYDEDAPRVSSITKDSSFTTAQRSRWIIAFNKSIHADTAIKENVCLTEPNGVCAAADAAPTTPNIVSVFAEKPETVSTMAVVINEGTGKTSGMRSIEFRRNAILAGNLYIAEDYQTALRDEIQLTNRIGPLITVTEASLRPNPKGDGDYLNYDVTFTVEADEPVPDLATPASYGLRYAQGSSLLMPGSVFSEDSVSITELTPQRKVTIVYNVTFNTVSVVQRLSANGMVLVRASAGSLEDGGTPSLGPNENINDGTAELAAGAELPGGRVQNPVAITPVITATAAGDAAVGSNARQYSGSFTVTVSDASYVVPDIGAGSSYVLLRKIQGDDTLAQVSDANLTASTSTIKTATVDFSATLASLDDARETEYFTLGRAAGKLLDIYSNAPNIADDARISTGAGSQANRIGINPRLTVTATDQAAMPASSNGNRYNMTFTVTASDTLSDIGDITAYTLIHIPTSGTRIDLTPFIDSSTGTQSGLSASLEYLVTFTDIADTQRTAGFTLAYADDTKLLSTSGDKPVRAADNSAIDVGDPIAVVTAGVVDATAVAARDTTAPSISISGNPADSVEGGIGGMYSFSFTAVASEPVQRLALPSSYRLLVAGTPADIGNDNLADTNISPVVTPVDGEPNTVKIDYQITLSTIRTILGESGLFVPYGFLLARNTDTNSGALRDASNNNPVQVNADGDATTTILNSDNTLQSVLQLSKVAVLDQDAPIITLRVTESRVEENDRTGHTYTMILSVRANENVLQITDKTSYTLMRVHTDNSVTSATSLGTVDVQELSTGGDRGSRAGNFSYTFEFTGPSSLENVRNTQGFTLALVAGRLKDPADNRPVDSAGIAIYNESNVLTNQGIIPPQPSNAPPSVMADRDTMAPTLAVDTRRHPDDPTAVGDPMAFADNDPTVYKGGFFVSSVTRERIRDIGIVNLYQLLRIPTGGGTPTPMPEATISSVESTRDGTRINLLFENADVGDLSDLSATRGFALATNPAIPDGERLRDLSNNNVVVINAQNQIAATVLEIEKVAPVITVRAIDIAGDVEGSTDSDGVFAEPPLLGDGSEYTMAFEVIASEEVPTLNSTASYSLAGVSMSDGNLVAIDQSNVTPVLAAGHSTTKVRINYTVTGVSDPTSLAGFTLARSDAESLIDKSGNSAVAEGARIDSDPAAIAARDTTPPSVTVEAQGSSPKFMLSADGTTYTVVFRVTPSEHLSIGGLRRMYLLASASLSLPTQITNLNIDYSGADYTADSNPITFTHSGEVSSLSDLTDIKAFTLVKGDRAVTDYSGNALVRYDGNDPLELGDLVDDRDAAFADIEIDRTPPTITVRAIDIAGELSMEGDGVFAEPPLGGDGSEYTLSFEVTADEVVPTLNTTASYSLAGISISDGNLVDIDQSNVTAGVDTASDSRATTLSYTVTGVSDPTSLAGFTLVRSGDASLRNRSGNPPAVADGARIDSNDLAIAYRDRIPPTVTITAQGSSPKAMPTADDGTMYEMVFNIVASEFIYNRAGREFHDLATVALNSAEIVPLNVPFGDEDVGGVSPRNRIFTYTNITVTDPTSIAGFTVVLQQALTDWSGNPLVYAGTTRTVVVGTRIDDRDAALADRDTTPPTITVRAIDIAGTEGTDNDGVFAEPPLGGDGSEYNLAFKVTADEVVPTLNTTASYNLAGISISDGNLVTINQGNVTPFLADGHSTTQVRINYRVTGVSAPRSLAGFTLIRSGAESLIDKSANPSAVADGARIDGDPAAIAYRDTTPPRLTVTADGTSPKAKPNADGTGYIMTFRVFADESLTLTASSNLLASVSISTPTEITNLNIERSNARQTSEGPFLLGFEASDLTDVADIKAFTLVRGSDPMTDYSGNPAIRHDGATIAVDDLLDNRPEALADRDTDIPIITVRAIDIAGEEGTDDDGVFAEPTVLPNFIYDGTKYTLAFKVTANKEVPTLNTTASYSLAGISISDGNLVAIDQSNVTPDLADGHTTTEVRINYTVTGVSDPTSLAGFTLVRNGAESLVDGSANQPAVADGERIDSDAAAIAYRDRTPPQITVTGMPTTVDADGNYTLQFTVNANEDVKDLNLASSYRLIRQDTIGTIGFLNQEFTPGAPTEVTANREYTIEYTNVNLADASYTRGNIRAIKGFTLSRSGPSGSNVFIDRSGNSPVKADGTTSISNDPNNDFRGAIIAALSGSTIDATAISTIEKTPPQITVTAPTAPTVSPSGNFIAFSGTFTVAAGENILGIGLGTAYQLIAVLTDGTEVPLSGVFLRNGANANSNSAEIGYTVNYIGNARQNVRDVKGFTLARSNGATASDTLIDYASNIPVDPGDTSDPVNSEGERLDSRDSAISLIEKTPPQITVTATNATVSPSGDDINFVGTFTVTASENILGIGSVGAYQLMRVLTSGGADVPIDATLSRDGGSVNSDRAVIRYSATLSGTSATSDTIATKGFTLARADNAGALNTLIDYSTNIPVDPGDTSNPVNSANERLDSRDSAISLIDTSAPSITVTALTDEATPVRVSNTTNTYIMLFQINADKAISDIDDPKAYTLMRIPSNGTTPLAITTTGIRDPNIAVRVATTSTIIFIGEFNAAQIADEQDTVGFTLGRATDADSDGNCRLCVIGSIKPTRGGGSSGTGDIEAGARIDNSRASVVARDMTPPQIQVLEFGNMTATEGISGVSDNGAFTVQFEVHEDVSEIPDINDQSREPYRILRKHSSSDTFSVVNSRQGGQAIPTIGQCQDGSQDNIVNCWEITATELVLPIVDALNTEHFTLGRAADRLRDASNNDPIVADLLPETIVRASDASAPLPLDWDTDANYELEREKPSITVRPSPFFRLDDDQICGSFSVSGADINGDEPIDGINSTASYSLLRIDPDGTVSELTDAGTANARCTGQGIVISAATPVSTDEVPFPSLLSATIHFNVIDVGVTTAHKYTLGRKERLTDISGNPLVDTVDKSREITDTADAAGRIDSRDTALGDIPPGDTTNPIINATVQDIDGDTSDMVEAVPNATDPLSFSGRFRVEVQQPDEGEENVARIRNSGAYRVVYISITNNQEVAIANQTITISNVTANRAATVNFTAVLPSLTAVRDVAAFKLKPVDLVDSGGNAPQGNQFTSTSESIDTTEARRDRTAPAIKVVADSAAVAQADDGTQYRMTFTVSVVGTPEDVRDLDDTSSYRLMRVGGNPFNLTVNSVSKLLSSNKRRATFTYTATVSSGIENITGFTLARANAPDSLLDRSGNAPVKGGSANNGSAIAVNGRIDDDNGALATREGMPPRITITATNQAATADASDNYTMQFTVSANEAVATLGSASSYGVRRIDNDNNLRSDANATASNPMQVTANRQYTISYTANLSGLSATEIRNTKGFTLVRVGTSSLIDRSGNPPVKADGSTAIVNGAVIAAVTGVEVAATAVAAREMERPQIEVRAINVDGFGAVPHATLENTYEGSFTVRSVSAENIKGLGATASYTLQRVLVVGSNNTAQPTMIITSSSDSSATVSVTIGFQATFTGTQDEISEAVRSTDGFTLSAGSLSLTDYASNLPQGISNVGDRLDTSDNAVAKVDRRAPRITVVAGNDGNAEADETDPLVYRALFTVTAPEDKPIIGLASTASYKVLRISLGDNLFDVDNVTITPQGTGDETEAMFGFTATLADITTVQNTKGFTLGYLANLRDSSGIIPQQFGRGRLDNREAGRASRDTTLPKITVRPQNEIVFEGGTNSATHTIVFDVSANERIRNINAASSYQLLRIGNFSSIVEPDAITGVTAAQANASTATVTASIELTDAVVGVTEGFTLARGSDDSALRDMASNDPVDTTTNTVVAINTRLDSRADAVAVILTVRVECAPFYPNIGQQDLFFKVTSESEPNLNGLTLTQGGTTLFGNTDTAELIGRPAGGFAILKARVSSEITDSAPISVSYADVARTVQTSCAIDNLANLTDSDGDSLIDIVDSNPYDNSVTVINNTVASASLATTPASTDTFYNRRVLVRSLLRGNEFTYVEGGDIKMAGDTALTPAEYFGIDYAAKTHLLAVESGSNCALILTAAQENKLSQVNFSVFCASEDLGVAEGYDFVNEVSITESQRYVWVGVDSAGRLKPSEYPDHTISALPEINISGQSSYFYTAPTTKSLIISAYAPDDTNEDIQITVKGTVVSGDPIADERVILQRRAATDVPPVFVGPKVYSGIHPVTGTGKNPQAGQTIRHWLIGDTLATTINVWHATEAKLTLPTSGGYTEFDDAKYAIGDYSHVDVRTAKDGSSEPITQIHQLLLYDVTEPTVSRVTSVIQEREYYLIADLTTNIENIGDEVLVAMPQGGYTIRTTANVVIRNSIGNSGHLIEQESFELIAFRVNSDAGDTISVGWDKIGTAENILASYRVTAEANKPKGYNEPGEADNRDNGDSDFDRIRNALDESQNWHFSLPVAVDNEIRANDWLGAVGWYDQPLYVSDEGLIIAFAEGDDMEIDYSAANIDYSGLTTDTRTQLGFTDDDSITSLATFGIRSVVNGFSQENNADAMAVGGIAYAVFPIDAGTNQPLYISRYNEEAERWERFERGTHRDGYADTWYVIDREMIDGENTYCPLDIGVYRNEYITAGTDDMSFTANNQKCVLVVITDGGPYDNSGINGRIDALLAIGTRLQPPSLPSRGLQCAAFYPNIGQRDLFFELDNISFDANGFAIEQGGNPLTVTSATQVNTDATDADPIVKLTLSGEIVSLADIIVTYTAAGEGPSETMCVASLKEDTDDDDVADIVDNNPFDPDDTKPNPDITGPPSDNDDLFVESDIFYSRDVVVRSLLRGESFDYIEADENDKPIRMTHSDAMTPAEYFGVDADARIYEHSEMCEAILAAAQVNGLIQVKIDEFCTEDITDDFVDVIKNDFVEKGSEGHRYLWATVRGGLLVTSYIGKLVRILPEINFLGQNTYLFAEPTTKTVIISAYVGNSIMGEDIEISVKGASPDEDNDFSDSEEVTLTGTDKPKDRGTILSRDHDITSHGEHPGFGETNIRWLSEGSEAPIWQPMKDALDPKVGGYPQFADYKYAIGTRNNILVRVAAAGEPVTEIRQVLLYEVTDSDPPIRRVTSMVAGKSYYVAVDFDTNIADKEIEIEPAVQHMALYTITTVTHVATAKCNSGHEKTVCDTKHIEKEEVAIIVITVVDDISTDTAVITVGWNKVGSVDNVISRYLVRNTDPLLDYDLVDADLDGIPDEDSANNEVDRHIPLDKDNDERFFEHNNNLQVAIRNEMDADGYSIDANEDFLATQDEDRPTFLTYEGLVIADALNNDGGIKAINYSVVNNGDLSSDTQLLLGIKIDDTDKIDTIATFGVAGVEYGFELEGNTARPTGGEVYASFPIFVEPADEQIIYLGKYDYATGSWARFERGTVVTWYAINRPDVGACPTDVQVYQNQHQASGDEGMGFTAGPTGNCIMLVLSDGVRLYDSSSLDGRVLDPLSIGTKLFDKAREQPPQPPQPSQPHRRGGGGAIGVSDILLLIGALLLITVASRKRRKAQ